jgi:hypothetical protein
MPPQGGWESSERYVIAAIEDIRKDMAESRRAREQQNIELAVLKTKVLIFSTLMSFVGSTLVSIAIAFLKVR